MLKDGWDFEGGDGTVNVQAGGCTGAREEHEACLGSRKDLGLAVMQVTTRGQGGWEGRRGTTEACPRHRGTVLSEDRHC